MTANHLVMSLLRDGVPLSLLVDLAGLGVPATELFDEEFSWSSLCEDLAVAT
jgi:hypothetical protein